MRLLHLAPLVVVAMLLIAGPAPAANTGKMYLPPGKAGANQYGEDIPSAGGNTLAPASTGRNTAAAQISNFGSARVGVHKLAKLGKQGAAAAQLAQQTAPAVSGPAKSGPNKPRVTGTRRLLTASGGSAISGLGHLMSGSDQGGIGIFLPLLLALGVVAAVVLGALRPRHPSSDAQQP